MNSYFEIICSRVCFVLHVLMMPVIFYKMKHPALRVGINIFFKFKYLKQKTRGSKNIILTSATWTLSGY